MKNYIGLDEDGGVIVTRIPNDQFAKGLVRGVNVAIPDTSETVIVRDDFIRHYGLKFSADLRGDKYDPNVSWDWYCVAISWWCRLRHWRLWTISADPNDETGAWLYCPNCDQYRAGVRRSVS